MLVAVLWILTILTVMTLGFARRAMLERQMAWYAFDKEQAQQMARGAAERALFELRNKVEFDAHRGQSGYTGLDQRWAQEVDLFSEANYFGLRKDRNFENEICRYRIEDCERYVSLNDAPAKVLDALRVLNFKTIERIGERRATPQSGYQRHRFASIDEVLDMERIRDKQWYGTEKRAGLREVLTVWGDPREGRINVNTAPEEVLRAIPGLDRNVLEALLEFRNGKDGAPYTRDDRAFRSLNDIAAKIGVSAEEIGPLQTYAKTTSEFYTIHTEATRRNGRIRAQCTVTVRLRFTYPEILDWREDVRGA